MRTYDLANMLGAFDESFSILIRLLERGEAEIALIRAKKMQGALHKCMGFLDASESDRELIKRI
jgi:hypothetical protein